MTCGLVVLQVSVSLYVIVLTICTVMYFNYSSAGSRLFTLCAVQSDVAKKRWSHEDFESLLVFSYFLSIFVYYEVYLYIICSVFVSPNFQLHVVENDVNVIIVNISFKSARYELESRKD